MNIFDIQIDANKAVEDRAFEIYTIAQEVDKEYFSEYTIPYMTEINGITCELNYWVEETLFGRWDKDLIKETEELAGSVHPAWDKCNEWAKGMHSRNCHQILGYNLDSPVDAVICWTPNGKVVGGTRTAIKLAMKYNIPVFNLGESDKEKVLNDIKEFLISKGVISDEK